MEGDHTWYIIVNPAAGSGRTAKRWPKMKAELEMQGIAFETAFTEDKLHAIELVRVAVENGYRKFISVGGDGTANEVINGIFQQYEVDTRECTFAVIPDGTGNDWIKTHSIPNDFKKAIALIKAGHTVAHDIGVAQYHKKGVELNRYFINVAGMGYDAFVTKASNEMTNFVSNKLFYFWLIFKCLGRYKPARARVTIDGVVHEDLFYTMNAGICIYNGGGAQFTPHAVSDDGLLAFTGVRNVSKLEVVLNTAKIYSGKIINHPKAFTAQAKHIKLESTGGLPTLLEVDGEYLGETPIELSVIEKAIQVIKPK